MTGKTHKAIGTAVGIAIVLYGVGTDQPMYALGMATAPLGAMLPDADHDMSKLGAARKKIVNYIRIAITVAVLLGGLVFWFIEGRTLIAALKVGLVLVPPAIAVAITTSQKFKEKIKFLTKHRGIMHTLLVPTLMMLGAVYLGNEYAQALLIGLSTGYTSHLLADCTTKDGCPLAWPISEESVKIPIVTTGTFIEYVMGAVLSLGIIFYGYYLAEHPEAIIWLFVFLFVGIGQVTPNFLFKITPKKYRTKKGRRNISHNILIPVAATVIVIIFVKDITVVAPVVGFCAGFCAHVVKDIIKKK